MRLRGTTASALEEMGEDTEGVVEDASKLYETVKNLTKVASNPDGISILADDGSYKSTYEILLEISKIYEELDDMSQASLLETIAGKTRGSAVAGILQSGDVLESAYNDAMNNSAGAGEKALEESLDSVTKKLTKLQNAWQNFWREFIDNESLKVFYDILTAIVGQLTNLVGSVGSTAVTSGLIAGLLTIKDIGRYKMSYLLNMPTSI